MATPKGMRTKKIATESGDSVHIYSNTEQIVSQLCHQTSTETDLMIPSFKVAVELSDDEVIAITGELLTAVAMRRRAKIPK